MENNAARKFIRLVPLLNLPAATQMKIRDIRNEEGVRRWMYTDHMIDTGEHLSWIERLKTDSTQIVFAVLDDDRTPLGVASANALNPLHQRADWAYYLTSSVRGGLGAAVEYAFIDSIFDSEGIEKLNCEVIEGNDAVVKLHRKFLFEEEGFRRSHVQKNGTRPGIHLLGLTRAQWMAGRTMIYDKYRSVLERFSVSIQWPGSIKADVS